MISIRKNRIKNLLLISLMVLILLALIIIIHKKEVIKNGIAILQGQKIEKKIIEGLIINDTKLIYDIDNNLYYYPINLEKNKEELELKIISSEELKSKIGEKEFLNQTKLSTNINYNEILEIRVESFFYKDSCGIKFTNIPIVSINCDEKKISTQYSYSEFLIIDPDYKENNSRHQFNSTSKIRYRGNSTLEFPKKSYRVKFEENIDFGLLGMNQNKIWILDPMVTDNSNFRTKMASDIWGDMNQDLEEKKYGKLNSKYVELYVNQTYRGLYLLKEVVDEKLLNLNTDTGVLLKGVSWEPLDLNGYHETTLDVYGPFEMKYPKKAEKRNRSWKNLFDKIKQYYAGDVSYHTIDKTFYIENLTNYRIFLWILDAMDNYEFKNVYFSTQNDNMDTKVLITPWDLDVTFGMVVDEQQNNIFKKYEKIEEVSSFYDIKECED